MLDDAKEYRVSNTLMITTERQHCVAFDCDH